MLKQVAVTLTTPDQKFFPKSLKIDVKSKQPRNFSTKYFKIKQSYGFEFLNN
jgi:hypothetical protein